MSITNKKTQWSISNEERKQYVSDYVKQYMIRYTYKINMLTANPSLLQRWELVENKSACITFCLEESINDYLMQHQGFTFEQVYENMKHPDKWIKKQEELREGFSNTLSYKNKHKEKE